MEEAETLKAAIDSGRYDYATLATQIEILTGVVVARLNESEGDCGFLYVCGVGLNCCCFHNLRVLDV